MSAFDRISSIENRLSELDQRLSNNGQATAGPARLKSGKHVGTESVSFESLVSSLADKDRFKGAKTAHSGAASSAAPAAAANWKGDPKDFDGMINQASKQHNVDEHLIRAVIRQESAFNPKATSWCGAQGLMQLMPETAKELGCQNSMDPYQNIMAGTKYLRQLLDRFGGDMTKAVAGYNAGPGAVEAAGGVPPYDETQNYVVKVLENYRNYKAQVF